MSWDKRKIIGLLRFEIENIRRRGFGASFRDSVLCLSAGKSIPIEPCSQCVLLELVPPECRQQPLPCCHIPLDAAGHTVEWLARYASRGESEQVILAWMERTLERLEKERATERASARPG